MSKVVLKNTHSKSVVKIVSEDATTIAPADLAYTVTIESGESDFGAVASKGTATRVQTPTHLEISKVIFSQAGTDHIEVKRGADVVMEIGGTGEIDFEGMVCENESSILPIDVVASVAGHHYTAYFFINKIGG